MLFPAVRKRITHYFARLSKYSITRHLISILIVCATLSSIATYGAITKNSDNFGPDPHTVLGFVLIDLVFFLALAIVITRKLISLRATEIGSRLQRRIVLMFSLVAAVPTIIVAVFSVLFFNFGIQSWFNERVNTALYESVSVAEAYLKEHRENIKADILAMAHDLNRHAYDFINDGVFFNNVVSGQAEMRALSEAVVFRSDDKTVLARANFSFSLILGIERLTKDMLAKADQGEIVIITNEQVDRVRALIKLDDFFNTYLLVGRPVDSKVLMHIEKTHGAVNEYNRLKSQISNLQIKFSFVFAIVALLLLLVAILLGIMFASAISKPINVLVRATERVKNGDFSWRVKEGIQNDEISTLQRAFNLMTEQISYQRSELIEATRQIDARRHFSETVIGGVSAGIIALNTARQISMINKSACNLLSLSSFEVIGKDFVECCPEMASLLEQAETIIDKAAKEKISTIKEGKKIILLVRIVAEQFDNSVSGYIVTFDDITALLTAQRSATWADVARRIAHEIKNPLTPVRLASERLRKKYISEVTDSETFSKYTDTIIRHASDIGKIVDEFVNFARMPAPVFAINNLSKLVNDAIFSRQCISTGLEYQVDMPNNEWLVNCDAGQIDRVLTNIFKNSEESIEQKGEEHGVIGVSLSQEYPYVLLTITDNGIGFQNDLLDRLTEPYVTTKAKGTGLGLAIVKKIIDDHNGNIQFANNLESGATIKIYLLQVFLDE